MRTMMVVCALAVALATVVSASSPGVLTYVSCDKAGHLREKFTKKSPEMEHYWEKSEAWVCAQKERSFPMDKFDNEYAKFESDYFRALPSVMADVMDIDDVTSAKRMLTWMWFTK